MIALLMTILLNPGCDACGCSQLGRVYVGGSFTSIGTLSKTRCALINPAGIAENGFTCTLDDDANVFYLDEPNGILWIGGWFKNVNGVAQAALVAVDWNTGTALFSPALTGNYSAGQSVVYGLYADTDNNRLYVTGDFKKVGATTCSGAVRFNLGASPSLDTSWLPVLDGDSLRSSVYGSTVYIVGAGFGTVNGVARASAAAVDDATGTTTKAWNPNFSGGGGAEDVLVYSDASVFLTGNFVKVNGAGGQFRRGLAEVDGTNGTVTNWDPGALILASHGFMLEPMGDGLEFFCAGPFTASGAGQGPRSVAQFFRAGAIDTTFQPVLAAGQCNEAHIGTDGRLYVCMGTGGDIGVFAVSVVDGSTFTDWLPGANANCLCVVTSKTKY